MKTRLFLLILFLLASIYLNPILADLAVDQGPSWSFGKEEHAECIKNYGEYFCETIKWLVLGDESYKCGNFNEALERYSNALALRGDNYLLQRAVFIIKIIWEMCYSSKGSSKKR